MEITQAPAWRSDVRLAQADRHLRQGETLKAEWLMRSLLAEHPDCHPAREALADLLMARDDLPAAREMLNGTDSPSGLFAMARLEWQAGDLPAARRALEAVVHAEPSNHVGWLMLGDTCEQLGDRAGSVRARYRALTGAQRTGRWLNPQTTEPALNDTVIRAVRRYAADRREHLFAVWADLRAAHGAADLARVDHALRGYLGDWKATPPDPCQRPKFFWFPGLPEGPYHDPMLQPWAAALRDGWTVIRDEAAELLREDRDFVSFLGLAPGQKAPAYVGGDNEQAAWDAFFFWRHGRRFDASHARCPKTSALLGSVDLCHVARQAPEVCFSLLRPRSTIMPHHGVTNTRLVFHLPLIVPEGCALNVVDKGEHAWREGEPMMFDDTYRHEAWNHSDRPRLILLMDCWNPHLAPVEREAVRRIVEAVDTIEN